MRLKEGAFSLWTVFASTWVRRSARAEAATGRRAVRISRRDGEYAASEWATVYDTGLPLVSGPFREVAAVDYHPLMLDLLERLASDLNRGNRLTPATRFGLRVYGARYLLTEDGEQPVLPDLDDPAVRRQGDPVALEIPSARPAIAVLEEKAFELLADGKTPDWAAALEAAPRELADPSRSGVAVSDFSGDRRHQRMTVDAERSGVLLLSYAHLPGLVVRVDGEERGAEKGPYGLVGVEIKRGIRTIALEYRAPGYITVPRVVSLATLLLVLTLLGVARFRQR